MWQALETRLFPVQFISPSCLPFPLKDHSIFTFPPSFSPLFLFFQLLDNLYNTRPPPWTQIGFRCGETESEAEWLGNICDALNVNTENHIITSECSLMDSSVTTSLLLPFEVPGMLKTQTVSVVCHVSRCRCEKHNRGRFSCNCGRAPSSFVVKGDITHNSTPTTMFFCHMFLFDTARKVQLTAHCSKWHLTVINKA